MKTIILTLLLFTTAISITAQTTPTIKKWGFGAEVFPNSTFEIIKNDGTVDSRTETFYRDLEKPKFCLSGQIYATYKLNTKSSLSIGLGYQNTGNQTKNQQLSFSNNIDSRGGFTYDSTTSSSFATHVKYKYNHHNIQIPVFYSYNISKRFYARGGVSTIFNFSNTITQVLIDFNGNKTPSTNKDMSTPQFRTLNFSGNLGFGYTYFQSSLFRLYAQANIETTTLQLKKGAHLNRRPVSIGIILGVRI